jgi:hypothetical protein
MRRLTSLSVVSLFVALALATGACGSSSPSAPSEPPIPQYAGSWAGQYTVTGCNQSGGVAIANICGLLGSAPPYSFTLSQSGRSVTGSFALGSIQFPSTGGTIASGGSLGLQATTISNGVTIIVTWALNMNTSLTGTVTQVWTSTTLSGQANVVGTISTANRTAFTAHTLFAPRSVAELVAGAAAR